MNLKSELLVRASTLTPREAQILLLLSEGMLYKNIAEELGIAMQSVQRLLTKATTKLGARTGTQAVVWFDRTRRYYGEVGSPLPGTGRLR